jgi:hypothetical protein
MGIAEAVVEDAEGVQVRLVGSLHRGEQILGRTALLLGAQHGRGAVGVVAAEITDLVSAQGLEAAPDVGLDVLGQVSDVEIRVDVRQRTRHQDPSTRHRFSSLFFFYSAIQPGRARSTDRTGTPGPEWIAVPASANARG